MNGLLGLNVPDRVEPERKHVIDTATTLNQRATGHRIALVHLQWNNHAN